MCIELIGLATALAGTGASVYANQAAQGEMDKKVSEELLRQKGYAQKGESLFQQQMGENTPQQAAKNIKQGSDQANQLYQQVQQTPPATSFAPTVAGGIGTNQVVEGQKNNAFAGLMNQRSAALKGYDNYSLLQAIRNARTNSALGMNSNFARSSQSVLPYELQDAQHSYDTLSGIGSLMQTAGGLLGLYGSVTAPATSATTQLPSWAVQGSTTPIYTAGGTLVGSAPAAVSPWAMAPTLTAGFAPSFYPKRSQSLFGTYLNQPSALGY